MSTDLRETGAWGELRATGRLGTFVLLCMGTWLHAADSFLAATTMPPAVAEIGGLSFINWTLALYALAGIVSGAGTAMLARRIGMRRVLVLASLAYAAGCVASALAPNMAVMLAARAAQGVGGGMMIALTYVATQSLFAEHLWTRLMAVVSAIWGGSALAGPLIGGVFAELGAWRGAFWAFAVQALVLAVAADRGLRRLPMEATRPAGTPRAGWPWRALALLSVGTLLVATAGTVANAWSAAGLAAAGCVALVMAVRADGRGAGRLAPEALGQPASAVGGAMLMVLLMAAGSIAYAAYGPLLTERLFGVGPLVGGGVLAVESIVWAVSTVVVSGAAPERQGWLIRSGALLVLAGGCVLAVSVPLGPIWGVLAGVVLQGLGFGTCWPFMIRRIVLLTPAGERDLAASSSGTMLRVGYAVGASACGVAANAAGIGVAGDADVAWWVFGLSVPVLAAGAGFAWRLGARRADV